MFATEAICETLRDGSRVEIRPIRPSDLELERRFVMGLSPRTRYLRLLSGRELLPGELERWIDIDPAREIALIAVARDGAEQQVGVARCALDPVAPPCWDFAIVVADAWQGIGLGERLLACLIERAEAAGIACLSSVTLAENHRMLALARRLGFRAQREAGDATLMRVELRLGASPDMAPAPLRAGTRAPPPVAPAGASTGGCGAR